MSQHNSSLPTPTPLILRTVTRFSQATSSQLRRLHYQDGTERGKEVRSSRHLHRLTELGLIRRVWGVYNKFPEYVYMPAGTKTRTPYMHTLDITELYVRLRDSLIAFDPEPWCHISVGHMVLKPDSYVDLGRMRYWLEVDRGTEYAAQLSQKMNRYVNAYEQWEESTFPLCLWICHDADRKRFIETQVRRSAIPQLFTVMLFDEAPARLAKG